MLRHTCLAVVLHLLVSVGLFAQQHEAAVYRVTVVLKTGQRLRGLLSDVDDSYLRVGATNNSRGGLVQLATIRKVIVRRNSKKNAFISGAIVGGLLTGYAANQSLQKNQVRTPLIYGLTLTLSAAGGAAAGLLVGSLIGNISGRVIRPLDRNDPELFLFRQIEPFTIRYQEDMINSLPNPN